MSVILFKQTVSKAEPPQKGLNERQEKAILYVKEKGTITNAEYQKLFDVARNTASRDLDKLVQANLLLPGGTKGRGMFYILR